MFQKAHILLFSFIFLTASFVAQKKGTYMLDIKQSSLTWVGKKITGEHTGHVMFKSGETKYDGDHFTNGKFFVDMNSVTTTDLQGKWADKLMGHLKSKDFFNVEKHSTAELIIKSSKKESAEKNKYVFNGDLIIKGISKPVTFTASVSDEKNGLRVKTSFEVDRTLYDIKYGSGKFFDNLGDKTIYDKFMITIDALLTYNK